ncbi:hypothetical protein AB1Y20_003868 [Prymnesium parvum]|uniref:RING-type E3 ubiquitin transferase n=1 Tax=Prymnesium parvum TaxID=97485 RepID=A0AB34J660_PRYPA|mmetsp:Transcript_46262/g.114737  ORF Transcript_46262/g.114737 Transcript_46262/m.114737 type:complete len:548 (+) Transcript_46262:204-1847(+)
MGNSLTHSAGEPGTEESRSNQPTTNNTARNAPARPPPQSGPGGARQAPGVPGVYPGAQFGMPFQQTGGMLPSNQMHIQILHGMRPERNILNDVFPRQAVPQPQVQQTYTIRNDVNLKKSTLKLVRDASNPALYHLEFAFDASSACRISVHYAATENIVDGIQQTVDGTLSFLPLKPGTSHPIEHRESGLDQRYRTRPSHPLDTSLYAPEELEYDPSTGRYPIVVCLEAGAAPHPDPAKVHSQTTAIKLVRAADGSYTAKPIKQKILVGTTPYELHEIYGIKPGHANGADAGDDAGNTDDTRECVICMTENKDTTVLPCRHLCMCLKCAMELRVQSNRCPICRSSIEQLLQIKAGKNPFPRQGAAEAPSLPAAASPGSEAAGRPPLLSASLKKDSLKLLRDAKTPSMYHIEFAFNADTECRISVHYAATEDLVDVDNAPGFRFLPLKQGTSHPVEQRGSGADQRFSTQASHPLDASLYAPEELEYDPAVGRYPIVICLEAGNASQMIGIKLTASRDGSYSAQIVKQKIKVGTMRYDVQEDEQGRLVLS